MNTKDNTVNAGLYNILSTVSQTQHKRDWRRTWRKAHPYVDRAFEFALGLGLGLGLAVLAMEALL